MSSHHLIRLPFKKQHQTEIHPGQIKLVGLEKGQFFLSIFW